jgi:predicted DNA-binding protein with PD1-like motif
MKKLFIILGLAALTAGLAGAQETRTVAAMVSTPADDTKTNSDAVPQGYAINSQFQRVVLLRFKFKADLLAGIKDMVKQEKIKNAVILSGIGSVRSYSYHATSNREFPSVDTFVKNPDASADIAGMNGYVIGGRVHAHITFANPDKCFGGHLEPGTEVFAFAIVTLGVLDDNLDLSKIDDKTYR